jgi:predicted CXXCH cytochrome family protein
MTFINSRRTMKLMSLALILGGCGDQIVYRDRDRSTFVDPPANAGNFLGYSNADSKRTTCGNCHSGKQAQWQETAHASAFATLAASPASQPACEKCHSVSSLGNIVETENVGFVATRSARYRDVQCESCHGPGLTHVTNPDVNGNKPLAALAVSTTLGRGCGECHSGAHQPFVEEWQASRHAKPNTGSRLTNLECRGCHDTREALRKWGVRSTFLEENATEPMSITCGACHDPHEKRNPGQLRYPLDVASIDGNLCMKCHYKRATPEFNNQAPHSPQGPLLLGDAGWVPPNFEYPALSITGSHSSDRNPRLCAGCHVNDYTVTDKLTGAFAFRSTGHSFKATPCMGADGLPLPPNTVCDFQQRSYKACTSCHGTEANARAAHISAKNSIDDLALQVEQALAKVPASETVANDTKITTAEGARFNMNLARQPGSPIHNPFLVRELLRASLRQLLIDYGVTP